MFKDRTEAGKVLAKELISLKLNNPCLLAVPRGGIALATHIADALKIKIDLLVTRKIGHPQNPEVAIGAVMPDGSAIWDENVIERLGITNNKLNSMIELAYAEIKRRQLQYIGTSTAPDVKNKETIIVDDGIATGYTIRAAINWLKTLKPAKIIIAVPIAPPDVIHDLSREVDYFICPLQPEPFYAVGMYYQDFSEINDKEVMKMLNEVKQ